MKAIEIYRTEKDLDGVPGVYIHPGFAIERRGTRAVAAGQQALSQGLAEFGETIRVAMARDMISHNLALAQRDIADTELEFQKDPDHRTIPQRFAESLTDIREKYSEQIWDPAAQNMFSRKFENYATIRQNQMGFYVQRRELEAQQEHLIDILDTKQNLLADISIDDNITYRMHITEALDAINERQATGMISEKRAIQLRRSFRETAAAIRAHQDIVTDPEMALARLQGSSWERYFPGLDPEKRLSYIDKARTGAKQIANDIRIADERAEKAAQAQKKAEQEQTYGEAVIMWSKGELTEFLLRNWIANQEIDPAKGRSLIEQLRQDVETLKNNPVIVGDLAEGIELGQTSVDDLDNALNEGQIKPEPYITMRKNLANEEFQRGIGYIARALKPSEIDRWTPDKHVRYAEAIDDYQRAVARDEDPMEAAREIVDLNVGHIRRTLAGLRSPRFLIGEKTDLKALRDAQKRTVEKYRNGIIDESEFSREAGLLEDLIEIIAEIAKSELLTDEMKKRIEQSKKARP